MFGDDGIGSRVDGGAEMGVGCVCGGAGGGRGVVVGGGALKWDVITLPHGSLEISRKQVECVALQFLYRVRGSAAISQIN